MPLRGLQLSEVVPALLATEDATDDLEFVRKCVNALERPSQSPKLSAILLDAGEDVAAVGDRTELG